MAPPCPLAVHYAQRGAHSAAGGFHGHGERHLLLVAHDGYAESLLGLQAAQGAGELGAAVTLESSTLVITSPALIPAFSAAEPFFTDRTRTPSCTPKKSAS